MPPNPSELIGSDRMRKLMVQLESEFDLVICDAPSMLVVTDPVLLATEVDACVLVLTARNILRGDGREVPAVEQRDSRGLKMAIAY